MCPWQARLACPLSGGGETYSLASTNTYSGATTVSSSFLQLAGSNALPTGNLVIDGGVIELAAGNFTLGAGTGTSQVQFTSKGGGFAAVGSNYFVNLGSLSATMTWGSTYFLPSSGSSSATLVLGSPEATATIDFQNPINLGTANRTVQVNMGSGTAAVDAKLSGAVSGSGGGLSMTGNGVLALTASNSLQRRHDRQRRHALRPERFGLGQRQRDSFRWHAATGRRPQHKPRPYADGQSGIDVSGISPRRWAISPSAAIRST